MTDNTDDIAEEISFQSFDDDCKLLGNMLNDVLQREVGSEFMEKLERNRVLAQVWLLSWSIFFSLVLSFDSASSVKVSFSGIVIVLKICFDLFLDLFFL